MSDVTTHGPHLAAAERCLRWADTHLRLAEAITAGATLVAAHRHLLGPADLPVADTCLSHETCRWLEFLRQPGRSA